MTIVAILSVFAGMFIGIRFKILAIVPAIVAATLTAAAVTLAQGDPVWSVIGASVLGAIGVQAGYLCGSFVPHLKEVPESAQASTQPSQLQLDIRARSAD